MENEREGRWRLGAALGGALVAALALAFALPAVAQGQQRVIAGPIPTTYLTSSVTINRGEPLNFLNADFSAPHDVASSEFKDGEFLFKSEIVDAPADVPVVGAEKLAPGDYGFFCTVHPWMEGTLTVSGEGGGGDTTPPEVAVKVTDGKRRAVRRRGALGTKVTVDEPATVRVRAVAGKGKKRKVIAKGRREVDAGSSKLAAKLTKAGKRALGRGKRVKVTVKARATDEAGNTGKAKARKTLR